MMDWLVGTGLVCVGIVFSVVTVYGGERLQRWRHATGRSVLGALARRRILESLEDGEWHPETTIYWMRGLGDSYVNELALRQLIRERRVEHAFTPNGPRVRAHVHYFSEVPPHALG